MTNDRVQQALMALDSADVTRRFGALWILRGHKDERIAQKVIPLLLDESPMNRRFAAHVLGENGDTAAVPALINTLHDEVREPRIAAAMALGQIGDNTAVSALIDALRDQDIDVRRAAAEALGRLRDVRAVFELIRLLFRSDDYTLAGMAEWALRKIGTPEAMTATQLFYYSKSYQSEILKEDTEETIRHIPANLIEDYLEEEEALPPEATREASHVATESVQPDAASPVQFSAYYPREVAPNVWNLLRAYVFIPGAAAAVAADAAQELGALLPAYREVERTSVVGIAEGALITATPELAGFQFNPPSAQVGFFEDWQRFDFKLRAVDAPADQASNGRISFSVEGVIVADIPLSIYVSSGDAGSVPANDASTINTTRPIYQSIFCSYSHQDTQIVERVERAYKALGLTFLRDVITLRSGQDWDEELLRLIDSADIFQLFWSNAASASKGVRREWEHALSLKRQDSAFIRPVYWQQPMPPPAPELAAIHFAFEPELGQA